MFQNIHYTVSVILLQGLFRKILRKKLRPAKIARMTPDELASKELQQWRDKEMQSVSIFAL